jgi:hypothetical protein
VNGDSDIPPLERPAFFDGQQLTAEDLAAVQVFHRELLWLHQRSLHNWGIATGLALTGRRGDREVTLQPGYALDCVGRELVVSDVTTMPIPAVAGASGGQGPATYYLTVSYAEDEDLPAVIRAGTCGTADAVRRPERATVRWQDPTDRSEESGFRQGLDVVLGAISVEACRLAVDVSAAERRDAIPEQQPFVFAGQTPFGGTSWDLWPDDEAPLGVVATVATNEAGFRTSPRYQARVEGERLRGPTEDDERTFVVDGYAQVGAPTATGFELRVVLPEGFTVGDISAPQAEGVPLNPPDIVFTKAFLDELSTSLGWHVVWMGVEG